MCMRRASLARRIAARDRGASRPTTSRSTCRTRASRRCAPRRTTSISSSPRPRCAASRSRRCIRTTSAPSWSTARPSTCTTAPSSRPRRSSPSSRAASRSTKTQKWQLIGHHHSELLAQDHRAGARRRQGRERRAAAAALDARAGPRRGSAGALSAGRLLARAPAAADEPELERLRLVVPGRADRDEGAADRQHQEVVFDPNTRTFRLQFMRGGSATLRLETLDIERPGARRDARSAGRRRPAVRGAALDVRHRDQQRRRASRLAREGRAKLGARSC